MGSGESLLPAEIERFRLREAFEQGDHARAGHSPTG